MILYLQNKFDPENVSKVLIVQNRNSTGIQRKHGLDC
jgi:hypothetical protein